MRARAAELLAPGTVLHIGPVRLVVREVRGHEVRLAIAAPAELTILRGELLRHAPHAHDRTPS